MKTPTGKILSFISAILFFSPLLWRGVGGEVYSQSDNLSFEHLSMKDGLSMNPVMSIVQDKKGFLWFGTQDGLNKYDGYKFTIYKTIDGDTTSISDNFTTIQTIDKNGNIWIGTYNNGLNKYDVQTGKFRRFSKNNSGLINNRIHSLLEDKEGQLWIGTDEGLCVMDIQNEKVISYLEKYSALKEISNLLILGMFEDSKGRYWLGTTNGLFQYFPKEKSLHKFFNNPKENFSLSNSAIFSVFESKNGTIWIGTVDGLNKYNEEDKNFTVTKFEKSATKLSKSENTKFSYSVVNNYNGNSIRCFFEDEKNNLWMGTDFGLKIFNPQTGDFRNYTYNPDNPGSFSDKFIRSIYRDNSNNLWIGTMGAGLNKLNLKPKKFQIVQKIPNDHFSLNENYVRAFAEDKEGNMWVGIIAGGLDRKAGDGKFYHYLKNDKNDGSSVSDNNIWALLFEEKNNLLWIGTNNGLNQYNPKTKKFQYYIHNDKNPNSISDNTVRNIFIDSKENFWLGTEGGLNHFDFASEKFISYNKSNSEISDNTVWKTLADREGKLWLATNDGLNQFDPHTKKFRVFKKKNGDANSLSHNGIRTLHIDKNGTLWVGTQNGLNKFDSKTEKFTRYDETSGLPNAFIYCIMEDENGNLWFSTNKGVSQFISKTNSFKNYDINDGLQDYEFNTNAGYKSKSGEMFFGGPNGYNHFNPEKIFINNFIPNVELTDIKVMGKSIHSEKAISEVKEITLQYDQNILYFEFASLDLTNPKQNIYSYKMEGFNKDWTNSNNRFINYTNLDPGEYIFKVKGTNSDGVWNEKGTWVKIIIEPPFWKTKWFYALCILILGLSIYTFFRVRTRNLRLAKKHLEEQVFLRTAEIAEKNKELEKLSIVASETDNGVIIADANRRIEWFNNAIVKMHGFTDEDVKRNIGMLLTDGSSNPELPKIIEQCIREKKSVIYETINENKLDGRKFWAQSTLTPIFDESGKLKKLVLIDTDITERKKQEEIIQQKNKNIIDSLNYARRIQEAILPSTDLIFQTLQQSFILYKPRDIVSGDFYFFAQKNERVVIGAVDCTGHGVPGAFMSLIGSELLNQIVVEKGITEPSLILNQLNENIRNTLKQYNAESESRDGMDVALCSIDLLGQQIEFAGAYRPLYFVRKKTVGEMVPVLHKESGHTSFIQDEGEHHNYDLREVKGNKFPVAGFHLKKERFFTNNHIHFRKGDTVYIFSDGFADQFGGKNNEKFLSKRFKNVLLSIQHYSMKEQGEILERTIEEWRGSRPQMDDILVIGIRL